jgi:acetylornithine aminotransferase
MPLAKGLGSGVPVGAVVAGPKAAHIFAVGNHGSTFGGNPLAMRAGLATIAVMERDGLLANAQRVGDHLKAALTQGLAAQLADGSVKDIRGQGLMLGIELAKPCGPLMQQAVDKGLLISVTADSVVRLVPSLILTESEASEIAAILCPLIRQFLAA